MSERHILAGYAADAVELIPRFEAPATSDVLAPVMDLLPDQPCHVLDVGAGTGRDAAWLASRGHEVLAVEPTQALREAGIALHSSPNIRWVDDSLPGLEHVRRTGERYGLILAVAVWQHLRPEQHARAVSNLAALINPGGRLILSLRQGPGSPERPCFPAAPEHVAASARGVGLNLIRNVTTPSIQAKNQEAGVTWTWLCFDSNALATGRSCELR